MTLLHCGWMAERLKTRNVHGTSVNSELATQLGGFSFGFLTDGQADLMMRQPTMS